MIARRPILSEVITAVSKMQPGSVFISMKSDGSWSVNYFPETATSVEFVNGNNLRKSIKKALDRLEGLYDNNRREVNSIRSRHSGEQKLEDY